MAFDEKYPLALPTGTVLAGRYIIEKVLGQGGFGITYRAVDHKTNEKVAVKEFFPDTLAYREGTTVISYPGERSDNYEYGKEGFLQEAQTLAEFIGCENIVRIHTYFEENGTAYFAMDYIEGVSFDEYLKERGGKISCEEAEQILLPIMDALYLVHSKGIVHRDVTPDNIYITNDGKVKLLDFGAARYSLGDKSRSLDVILKHGFAPKEQYTRRGKQGPFTDIYSLGATFYFALTGRRPPDSVDRLEEDDLIPPSSLGVQITEYQEQAILQALSVQPGDRFESMLAFKNVFLNEKQQAPAQQVAVQPVYTAPVQQAPAQQVAVQPVYTAPVQQAPAQQAVIEKTQAVVNNQAKDEPKPKKTKKEVKKPAIIAAISAGVVGLAAAIIVPIAVNSSSNNVPTGGSSSSSYSSSSSSSSSSSLPVFSSSSSSSSSSKPASSSSSSKPASSSSSSKTASSSSSSGAVTVTTKGNAKIIGNSVGNIKNHGYASKSAFLDENYNTLKVAIDGKWTKTLQDLSGKLFNICEEGNYIYDIWNGYVCFYDIAKEKHYYVEQLKGYRAMRLYLSKDYFFILTTDKVLHRVSRKTYEEEETIFIPNPNSSTFSDDSLFYVTVEDSISTIHKVSSTNFKKETKKIFFEDAITDLVFDNGYLYFLEIQNNDYFVRRFDANLSPVKYWGLSPIATAVGYENATINSLNVVDDHVFFAIKPRGNDGKYGLYHYNLKTDKYDCLSKVGSDVRYCSVFKYSDYYEVNYVTTDDGVMRARKYDLNGSIKTN